MGLKDFEGEWMIKVQRFSEEDVYTKEPVKFLHVSDTHIVIGFRGEEKIIPVSTGANRDKWVPAKEALGIYADNFIDEEKVNKWWEMGYESDKNPFPELEMLEMAEIDLKKVEEIGDIILKDGEVESIEEAIGRVKEAVENEEIDAKELSIMILKVASVLYKKERSPWWDSSYRTKIKEDPKKYYAEIKNLVKKEKERLETETIDYDGEVYELLDSGINYDGFSEEEPFGYLVTNALRCIKGGIQDGRIDSKQLVDWFFHIAEIAFEMEVEDDTVSGGNK